MTGRTGIDGASLLMAGMAIVPRAAAGTGQQEKRVRHAGRGGAPP